MACSSSWSGFSTRAGTGFNQQQQSPGFRNNGSSELFNSNFRGGDTAINIGLRIGSKVRYLNPIGKVEEGIVKFIRCCPKNRVVDSVVVESLYLPMTMTFHDHNYFWAESARVKVLKLCECKPFCGALLSELLLINPNVSTINSKPENKTIVASNPINLDIVIVWFNTDGKPLIPPICLAPETKPQWFGICGDQNSCYMDSLLMSLFAFHTKFDFMLESNEKDRGGNINNQDLMNRNICDILRCYVVNPLRMFAFCRSQNVQQLRALLGQLNPRVMSDMMDVEEFSLLLFETLKLNPFLQYISGMNDFLHQILVCDTRMLPKTVDTQALFEVSMLEQRLEWTVKPSPALFLVMPRNAGSLTYFERIIPSPFLDVTDFVIDGNRQCIICAEHASFRCQSCYNRIEASKMKSMYFCSTCILIFHKHPERLPHKYYEFENRTSTTAISSERSLLHLMAVICIRSKHYVAFLKTAEDGQDWAMYDSDPLGGNPKIEYLPNLMERVEEFQKNHRSLQDFNFWKINGYLKRLMTDGYVYIYC